MEGGHLFAMTYMWRSDADSPEFSSPLPLCGSWGSNLGQAWQQVSLSTELSYQPLRVSLAFPSLPVLKKKKKSILKLLSLNNEDISGAMRDAKGNERGALSGIKKLHCKEWSGPERLGEAL